MGENGLPGNTQEGPLQLLCTTVPIYYLSTMVYLGVLQYYGVLRYFVRQYQGEATAIVYQTHCTFCVLMVYLQDQVLWCTGVLLQFSRQYQVGAIIMVLWFSYGVLWYYDALWYYDVPTVYYGLLWCTMMYLWCAMVYYGVL